MTDAPRASCAVRWIPRRCAGSVLTLAATCLAACATPDAHTPRTVDVVPYGRVQECLHVSAGQRLNYRFEASHPVQFAIQYRDGAATLAPITRDDTREDSGIYPAAESREYCATWDAGAAGVHLRYSITLQ